MRLPDLVAYQAAVQHPSTAFSDPQLRAASVTTGNLGLPRAVAGNFAVTYQLRAAAQQWAVRCFHREAADRAPRYAAISQTLARVRSGALVPIDYLDTGVRVGQGWYPITKMVWIDGFPLNRAVEASLSKPAVLRDLERRFIDLVAELRKLGIAHGDLQHGNILVEPSGNLRLVDYDGMFVPALRGRSPNECGDPNYQHPRRGAHFDADLDRFAALTIVVALRALAVAPRLWHAYNTGDNLLFRRTDFADPPHSALFRELDGLAEVRDLAQHLAHAARADYAHVPLLEDVLAPPPRPVAPKPMKAGHVAVLNTLYGPRPARPRAWKLHRASVQAALAFSPDGSQLATAERNGQVTLRDVSRRRTLRSVRTAREVWAVAFSARRLVAVTSDGPKLCLWDADERRQILELPCSERPLRAVALSANGAWLAAATSDGTVRCWRLAGRQLVAVIDRCGPVSAIAISRDGRYVAAGLSRGEVRVYALPSGQTATTLRVGRRATCLAFAADRAQVAVGTATGEVTLFDIATANGVADLASLDTPLVSLALAADGRSLAAGGGNGTLWLRSLPAKPRQVRSKPVPLRRNVISSGQRLFGWLRRVALL
jgi:anaphase-promoting complex subunit 4